MKQKIALIVGAKGQDGILLTNFLIRKSYHVIAVTKNMIEMYLQQDGLGQKPIMQNSFLITEKTVQELFQNYQINEVYYLAAYHHSSEDNKGNDIGLYQKSNEAHVIFLHYFLNAIRRYSQNTKLFYASSSLIFGECEQSIQDENTPVNPIEIYGITKVAGMQLCQYYYEKYGVFACSGILYNHESILRKPVFLSRKIIQSVIKIKQGKQNKLVVGNLSAVVDWGYAPDFVEAFWKMLKLDKPSNLIIATGIPHTVEDFLNNAFLAVNLDWTQYVEEDNQMLGRKNTVRIGNREKISSLTQWQPSVTFEEMINLLIKQESDLYV